MSFWTKAVQLKFSLYVHSSFFLGLKYMLQPINRTA